MPKVLEIVKGDGQSFAKTVYTEEFEIVQYNPFESNYGHILPFDANSFDGVFSYFTLNCFPWRISLEAVKEMARVTADKGLVHILTPSARWLGSLMMQVGAQPHMRSLLLGDQSGYAGDTYKSIYNMLDLRVHIEASGLSVVTAKTGGYKVALGEQEFDAEQLYVVGQKL